MLLNKHAHPLDAAEKANDFSPLSTQTLKDLGSPSLERTADTAPCYINIEAVLCWSIFEDQSLDQRLDLKSLLHTNNDYSETPPMSVGADFESRATSQFLQRFLDNVHIFNPVLEETKVREYMRNASFNGIGWDSQSCLLLLIYALGSIAAPYEKDRRAHV